jgi:putative oxidoreductase
MKSFEESINWLNTHREHAYSMIRIFLGIVLFVRGIIMFSNPSAITSLAGGQNLYYWHSVIMVAHLFGGILLALGYQTRLAALLQLPILIGAVFFVHLGQGLVAEGQSLELSVLVMFLLVVYLLFGSGLFALDNAKNKKDSSSETVSNLA